MATETRTPSFAPPLREGYREFIEAWDHERDGYLYGTAAEQPPGVEFHREVAADLDPVTYEVLRHALWGSIDEHATTCKRGSGSPIVVFGHDFCPALLTEDAEYVYVAAHVTFLGNTSQAAVLWTLENRADNPGIEDGDMFITNDPWICGIHQMDVVLTCPVFVDGKLFCWVANTMHQYDVGGNTPGSFCAGARDVFDEGMLLPTLKIVERGVLRKDIEEFYLRHSRMPHLVGLDLRAEIAGCLVARKRVLDLVEKYGAPTVKAAMRRIIDDSEAKFLERLERLPDGRFSDRGYLESGVEQHQEGARKTSALQVNLTKEGSTLVFDNEGTDPAFGCLSSTLAGWRGAVLNAVMATFCYDLQYAIGGPWRHIELRPVPGTMSTASFPAAVSNTMAIVRSIGTTLQAISRMLVSDPLQKENIFTSPTLCGSAAAIPVSGVNQRGEPFASLLLELQSGGRGAFSFRDGIPTGCLFYDVQGAMPNIEHSEHHMPLLYLYLRELADSGGAGRFARGNAVEVAMKLHGVEEASIASASADVVVPGTPGLYGGYSGATNRVAWHRGSNVDLELEAGRIPHRLGELEAEAEPVPPVAGDVRWKRESADVLQFRVCGAAGYGDPLLRDTRLLAEDLVLGYVSPQAAEELYGAVLVDGEIDAEATEARREELRRARLEEFEAPPRRLEARPRLEEAGESMLLAETVAARRGADGEVYAVCTDCETAIAPAGEPLKDWLPSGAQPTEAISPIQGPTAELVDDEFEFRRWCCPGCGTLVDAEILRVGDERLDGAKIDPEFLAARFGGGARC